ncbi:MAG: hypothetical protein B6U88_02885, partial [Candidatus Aenigmarchaeota archaeon ex4484_56]
VFRLLKREISPIKFVLLIVLLYILSYFVLSPIVKNMYISSEKEAKKPLEEELSIFIAKPNGTNSIEGYIYSETGEPIHGANVKLSLEWKEGKQSGSFSRSRHTDENGYFIFSGLSRSGEYTLVASVSNVSKTKKINFDRKTKTVKIYLPITDIQNCFLEFYAKDENSGKPLEGVEVYEKNRDLSTKTNENGYGYFKDMTPGRVELLVSAEGYKTQNVIFNIPAGMTKLKKTITLSKI